MRPTRWVGQAKAAGRIGRDALNSAHVHRNEAQVTSSSREGPLLDWPVSVKDNFCTLEMPTSCSSQMLSNYTSPIEATAVRLLKQAGAHIVAKTNCDEFGMGSANLHSAYGPVLNPHSWKGEERVAGGSSGGAAASVSCGASRIALASDTGGSIRTPAAYCGVYGLKPSYGLISRWGLVAYADSLDTVGLLGSTSGDVRTAFDALSQHDAQDPTSISDAVRQRAKDISMKATKSLGKEEGRPLSGLRVGIPAEFFPLELSKGMLPAMRTTLAGLKAMGAELVGVSIPNARYALSAYYVLASAEASSNLARYDGVRYGRRTAGTDTQPSGQAGSSRFHAHISQNRSEGFGAEVQKRILLGTYSLTSDLFDNYFLQAQRVRQLVRRDFDRAFRVPNALKHVEEGKADQPGVDILVTPSTVDIAPTMEEAANMGIQAYTQDLLTVPASLAGLPAMTIPAATERDMPVGVSVTAQWGCEHLLFDVAASLSLQR